MWVCEEEVFRVDMAEIVDVMSGTVIMCVEELLGTSFGYAGVVFTDVALGLFCLIMLSWVTVALVGVGFILLDMGVMV